MLIRLLLVLVLFPLQSCSNTVVGEKLENSFDISNENVINEKNKENKGSNFKSIKNFDVSKTENIKQNIADNNSNLSKDKPIQKQIKLKKNIILNPQPYRIILKLSGANPSAPAETVTKALRKAGVQFEVEKIERFDERNVSKNSSLKR